MDGPTLAALLGQYVSSLNSGPQLNLESSWLCVIRPQLENVARKALAEYKSEMTELLLPLEEGDEETALESEGVAQDVDEDVGITADRAPEGEGDITADGAPEGEGDIMADGAPEGEGDITADGAPEGEGDITAD